MNSSFECCLKMRRWLPAVLCLFLQLPACAIEETLQVGGAKVQVQLPEALAGKRAACVEWVRTAANAITSYYGKFPVPKLVVRFIPQPGDEVGYSETGIEDGGGAIDIRIGRDIDAGTLKRSWVAAHEMTHLAFPMVNWRQRWVAEGQATYIEPLARLQVGDLTAAKVWGDLVEHLPSGLPRNDDDCLNDSDRINRIYWGGALYCLLADIDIRRKTNNHSGFQDAAAAIAQAGGTALSDWSVERALATGDRVLHVKVLEDLYAKMADKPYTTDLPALWKQLGVVQQAGTIHFDDAAPLASIRHAIERGHSRYSPRL